MKTVSHIQQEAIFTTGDSQDFPGGTTSLPKCGCVVHHYGHVSSALVSGVVLHPPQQLLDEGMSGVDFQGLLLVEVVVTLHVLCLWSGSGTG